MWSCWRLENKPWSVPDIAENIGAVENRTFEMSQGQKKSRFVAWTFMDKELQSDWRKQRDRT